MPFDHSGSHLMNPSIIVQDGQVLVAARSHRLEVSRGYGMYNGSFVTLEFHTWYSEIVLGGAVFDAEAWNQWPRTGVAPFEASLEAWEGLRTPSENHWRNLCLHETWVPENNTLIMKQVTGPEDPKIIAGAGGANLDVRVAFNSMPPNGPEGWCSDESSYSQMYLASGVDPLKADEPTVGRHLQCGFTNDAEKNWIPFTYEDQLYFVYEPSPHTVVKASADGTCEEVHETNFPALQDLAPSKSSYKIRGSGQAVLVNDTEATPNLQRAHFLALFHVYDESSHRYANYAYRFTPEPPFAVLQVSEELPLMKAASDESAMPAFAFASGLAVQNRTVVIAYGAGDRDARALVMTLDRLDEFFACSGNTSNTTDAR
jgi:hypothetical protein